MLGQPTAAVDPDEGEYRAGRSVPSVWGNLHRTILATGDLRLLAMVSLRF